MFPRDKSGKRPPKVIYSRFFPPQPKKPAETLDERHTPPEPHLLHHERPDWPADDPRHIPPEPHRLNPDLPMGLLDEMFDARNKPPEPHLLHREKTTLPEDDAKLIPPEPYKINFRQYYDEQRKKITRPHFPFRAPITYEDDDIVEKEETLLSLAIKIIFVIAVVVSFAWYSYDKVETLRRQCIAKYQIYDNPVTAFGTCRKPERVR
ncbi:MAG: hypothetical protein WC464_02615 [Bdellovibrionales bacterium]